jgi:predicted glycoside hydrolase/deacetylase ChbG (UPF0249 family)
MTGTQPRRIWLCADDFGISSSVNTAIRDLVVRGRLNATSVLVVAPSFYRLDAVSLNALNSVTPHVALGLHFALTAPFRPASKGFTPVRDGAFLPLAATFRHAALRRFRRDALVREIRSQLQAFIDTFGRAPDFVDGHQHVHVLPGIRGALLEVLGRSGRRSWLRNPADRATAILRRRLAVPKAVTVAALAYGFESAARQAGFDMNEGFSGFSPFDPSIAAERVFHQALAELGPRPLAMCHPGHVDAELERLDPLTTLREREYAYFCGHAFPQALKAHDLTLN